MFERFTDRARRVVVLAQEEARRLDHNHIGTEHLLLGLVHEQDGIAAQVLRACDVTLEATRDQVESTIGHGGDAPANHIPFTPRAKKVLELALREALQLGHNYIGTEHILLGLIREGEGIGTQVLVQLGVDLETARDGIVERLASTEQPGGPERRWFRRGGAEPRAAAAPHAPPLWPLEQLDDEGFDALAAARRAARRRAGSMVTARDLLMGVAVVPGPAADVLHAVGAAPDALDRAAPAGQGDGGDPPPALPYSDAARAVLRQAVEESRRRGHAAVGAVHILHVLARWSSEESVVEDLERAGVTPADLRDETARRLD